MHHNSNDIKISFIIPVYNSEKYIERCLTSILNQISENMEIICVNDFSSDNSGKILDEFAKQDSRIKVINNSSNLGAGTSRNIGLNSANGEYVFYIDSDDTLSKNSIKILTKELEKYTNIDVFISLNNDIDYITGFKIKPDNLPENISNRVINIFNTPDCIEFMPYAIWGKLLKRTFLIENNIYFNSYKSLEDIEHTIDILLNAKKILFINQITYNYTTNRKGSVVTKKYDNINAIIQAIEKVEQNSEKYSYEVKNKLLKKLYRTLGDTAYCAYNSYKLSYKDLKNIFLKYMNLDIIKAENLIYYEKIYSNLLKYSKTKFRIYSFARNIIKQLFPTFFTIYLKNKKHKCRN